MNIAKDQTRENIYRLKILLAMTGGGNGQTRSPWGVQVKQLTEK